MKITKGQLSALIIIGVILVDQIVKFWVKTSFYLGEDVELTSWFHLLFIENNGMAFGMELGSKLALTLFRIVAVTAIIWYLWRIRNRAEALTGYIACWAMIAAGAAGNIIDCVFYGVLFNNPIPPQLATFLPADGGYAPLFMGKVVDMLYFPLFSFDWPAWMPWVGGEHFVFFQPIFNIADASITVGIFILLIFYSKHFVSPSKPDVAETAAYVGNESNE